MGSLISKVPKAKMYQILRRGRSKLKSVTVGGREMRFKNKIFHTKDQYVAQAIADKYPHDTMSIPHDSWRDDPAGIHTYHFGTGKWKTCAHPGCDALAKHGFGQANHYCGEHWSK